MSSDTVIRVAQNRNSTGQLTSKSFDHMDYAIYNVHYEDDFDIKRTRPRHGSENFNHDSMLAYSNYFTQKQQRAQNRILGIHDRRHTIEVSENLHVHAKRISDSYLTGNSYTGRIPLVKKKLPSVSKIPKLKRLKGINGIVRGHSFPPLGDISKDAKSDHKSVHFITASDLGEVTNNNKGNESTNNRSPFVVNHQRLVNGWVVKEPSKQLDPDLSGILTSVKHPSRTQNSGSRDTDSHLDNKDSQQERSRIKEDNCDENSDESDNKDTETDNRKKHSEDILKSAISTLKLMEKEIDGDPSEKQPGESSAKIHDKKFSKRSKRNKRLQLPEQTLDIIPELDLEHMSASDSESNKREYPTLRSPKKSKLDMLHPLESRGDEPEMDSHLDKSTNKTFSLPPLTTHSRFGVAIAHDNTMHRHTYTSNKTKAKLDMQNKIRRKHTQIYSF